MNKYPTSKNENEQRFLKTGVCLESPFQPLPVKVLKLPRSFGFYLKTILRFKKANYILEELACLDIKIMNHRHGPKFLYVLGEANVLGTKNQIQKLL